MLILKNLVPTSRLHLIITDREKQEFLVRRKKKLTYKVTNYVQFNNKNQQTCKQT